MNETSGLPADVSGTVVTVGTFDGVHRGHLDVLGRLVARAREAAMPALLASFDPHPLDVVNPSAAPPLLTLREEKIEVLASTGINYFAVIPFTRTLATYGAREFVQRILLGRLRMRELLIGYDHGFGRQRTGNAAVLSELGAELGFAVSVVPPVSSFEGHAISSTFIRRAIAGGDLARAQEALGRAYSLSGTVIRGQQRGARLGFATLNISPAGPRKLLPPQGVYAVRVQTPGGTYAGMLNLGPRPTFGDSEVSIEAHLFDASGDFYGSRVRLEFVRFLRETIRFESVEALVAQLGRDREHALAALTGQPASDTLKGYPKKSPSTASKV